MNKMLGRIEPRRKTGDEMFHRNDESLSFDVRSFWQWSTSDLLSNATRGIVAEYLVVQAVGAAAGVRTEWDAYDVLMDDGTKIEVKSAAYVQSWHQTRYSQISFGTRPSRAWDARTNTMADERQRSAHVYVFCLLAHKDQSSIDPLNVAQWRFFIISTQDLNAQLGDQKSIGLNGLKQIGAIEVTFEDIVATIRRVLAE